MARSRRQLSTGGREGVQLGTYRQPQIKDEDLAPKDGICTHGRRGGLSHYTQEVRKGHRSRSTGESSPGMFKAPVAGDQMVNI